jgi:CBS domain containing-hemolysin-like protein
MFMVNAIWVATVIGVLGGVALAYAAATLAWSRLRVPQHEHSGRVRFAVAGTLTAALPGFFLSLVVGGTFGGAWGEVVLGQTGVPFGLAFGIAVVFAVMLLIGALFGFLVAEAVARIRHGRAT